MPHEEETLEVVRTAALVVFGDQVTEDQCVQLHDLIRHGLRLNVLNVVAWDYIDATVRIGMGLQRTNCCRVNGSAYTLKSYPTDCCRGAA